ncbi:hypothetical protein [Scleromatobacter humisilvae]|uniref:Uncharacterized protein n=1 Tax=Scleromatobacter humisilvae TaxID=2897159 RepID=A0A9X1YLT7_9BURK|nr:hypothetical protein [Scleromatobacter humisilvae]MCK9688316.1 hypothetical protein [Scleromatobacter humisilvae]
MRAPPPVEFTSAFGRAWRAALSLLVGASVAVPLAWGLPYFAAHWGSPQPDVLLEALADPRGQALIAIWGAAMAVAAFWLARRRSTAGGRTLRWDGHDWVLAGDAGRPDQRGDAALMLDLGPWMLVRFLPYAGMGSATWLPLTAGLDLARWAALRGALWNWRAGRGDARP